MSDLPSAPDLDAAAGPPPDDSAPVQTTMADLPGQLKEWLGGVGSRLSGWAQDAATVVNDFLTRRDIADQATQQANAFTNNVQSFSQGLDEVVRADPTATNMALGLAAITVPAIVADHPYLPDDQRDSIADQLAGDVGKSIARNAVIGWAQRDPDTAHAELQRLGGLFAPEEQAALGDHVDLIGHALESDNNAAAIQQANNRANREHANTLAYVDELVGPDGQPQFPANWMRRVVNDQSVGPENTATLQRLQERLQGIAAQSAGSPPPMTDGNKVMQFFADAQAGREGQMRLMDHVGVDLDLRDAQTLVMASKNPTETAYLNNVLATMQKAVKGADGDLDPDGSAMARQAHLFLSEYRALGRGALDPNDPNFLGALRRSVGGDALGQRIAMEQKAARLEDIFARRQQAGRGDAFSRQQDMIARQEARARRIEVEKKRFDIQHQLEDVHQKEAEARRQSAREEAARQRNERLTARQADQQQRAQFAIARAQMAAEAARNARADRASAAASRGGGGGRESATASVETFRRFAGLGRPERA